MCPLTSFITSKQTKNFCIYKNNKLWVIKEFMTKEDGKWYKVGDLYRHTRKNWTRESEKLRGDDLVYRSTTVTAADGSANGWAEQLVFWCSQNKLELNSLPKNAMSTVDLLHKHSQQKGRAEDILPKSSLEVQLASWNPLQQFSLSCALPSLSCLTLPPNWIRAVKDNWSCRKNHQDRSSLYPGLIVQFQDYQWHRCRPWPQTVKPPSKNIHFQ